MVLLEVILSRREGLPVGRLKTRPESSRKTEIVLASWLVRPAVNPWCLYSLSDSQRPENAGKFASVVSPALPDTTVALVTEERDDCNGRSGEEMARETCWCARRARLTILSIMTDVSRT